MSEKTLKFVFSFTGQRGVAQPGSASGLGPEGRRFESSRPDKRDKRRNESFAFFV